MSLVGPFAMVFLFVIWLAALVVGFGLMAWWDSTATLQRALVVAGSSVFTLGFATLADRTAEAVELVAGGTGLLVVALEIAYLPTLYARLLGPRDRGDPARHPGRRAGLGPGDPGRATTGSAPRPSCPTSTATWERWAAAVAESHTNYPSLMWFRSPVPWRSWLTAMTAMLDAAALHDAINPGSAPRQARNCLQMGKNTLRALAGALHIEFDPDPMPTTPIRLTYEEYVLGVERLQQVDFPFERTPEEAWRHFSGWRVNYEPIVDALDRDRDAAAGAVVRAPAVAGGDPPAAGARPHAGRPAGGRQGEPVTAGRPRRPGHLLHRHVPDAPQHRRPHRRRPTRAAAPAPARRCPPPAGPTSGRSGCR